MASAKQIAWRKKFAKLYGKKKTGAKSSSKKLERKMESKLKKLKTPERYGDKNQKQREKEFNKIFMARIRETNDPEVKKALKKLMFKS